MIKKSILFVCTGNVFRSLSAEYCLKQYLHAQGIKNWQVDSAGIVAHHEAVDPKVRATLRALGISDIKPRQRKLTRQMLAGFDIIVAMAQNHVDFIKDRFGYKNVMLFNDLAIGRRTSIWDIQDKVKEYYYHRPATEKVLEQTVREIHRKIPKLFQQADERYYLFSDFQAGIKTQRNGFPFIILAESQHALAFMSLNIPDQEDGHILVIPKKRYVDLADLPASVLAELSRLLQKIGRAIGRHHGGYNILLNNGADAQQYIFHVHFHLVPRNYRDGIKIEVWKSRQLREKDFIKLNKNLKKQISLA